MDSPDSYDKKEPKPARLEILSWCEAKIDLTYFGLGNVYITDAAPHMVTAWIKSAQKDPLSHECTANLLAAYVDHADDPSFPVRNAGVQAWIIWMKSAKQKAVKALTDCIAWFQGHTGDEAGAVPNA